MRWFKCPSLSSPEVIEAKKSIGFDGVMQCLMTIEEAFQWEVDELDEHLVSRWAKVKLDRARRILPFAQKIYQKSTQNLTKISSKSTQNLPKIYEKSTQNLGDFTPSNPRGCNKSIERIERENREKEKEKNKKEKISETPHCPPLRGGQDSGLKEKEVKPAPPRGTRLNPDWIPKPETIEQMRKERPDLRYERTLASFRDYWIAKAGKDGVKLDWEATFRNWFRNERSAPAHTNPSHTPLGPVNQPVRGPTRRSPEEIQAMLDAIKAKTERLEPRQEAQNA